MRKVVPAIVVVAALGAGLFLLMRGASYFAPVIDEPPHITAGYSYLKFHDYRLNPEHPPLTKALSGLFLQGRGLAFPTHTTAWQEDINGQWVLNHGFLYESGNDGEAVVTAARRGPIVVWLLLCIVFTLWLWRRLGAWWGAAGAVLLGFSPLFLAHGNLVTTDVAAALGALVGLVTFGKYLEQPTWKRGIVAGLGFGFAQLCKFSLVLLVPAYIVTAVLYLFWKHRSDGLWGALWGGLKQFLIAAVIGTLVVIYPVYYLFTEDYPAARQVRDTSFILGSFAGGPTEPGELCSPVRCVAEAVIRGAGMPVVRPLAHYTLGILMVVQRAAGGSTNYFLGEVSSAGSWSYFPVIYILKETLAVLVVLGGAALYGLVRHLRHRPRKSLFATAKRWVTERPTESLVIVFLLIYWLSSVRSSLNIGVRHLLPTVPLMYFLAIRTWKNAYEHAQAGARPYVAAALVALCAAQVVTALYAVPHFLSYYNALGGGTENGYRVAADSNYDWGQDLTELRTWLDAHPEVDKIAVAYFGGGNVPAYLGDRAVIWYSSFGDPREKGIRWFATSVNFLQTGIQPLVPGEERSPADEYRWLTTLRPLPPGMGMIPPWDARAGTSIFIYRLPPVE